MKRTAKGMLAALCAAAALLFAACGGNGAQGPAKEPEAVPSGQAFQVGGDGYMLSEIVRLSGYDTDTQLGYGVIVLMKENSAPVSFAAGGGSVTSLVDVVLDDGSGGFYRSKNIAFVSNDDTASSYKGIARFEFSLPRDAAFPETGTFHYTGNPAESRALSFAGMEATRTLDEGFTEAPAQDAKTQSETALSYEELAAFVNDPDISEIHIGVDMAIQLELAFERTAELTITIDEGVTLTVAQPFTPVNCTIVNNGTMVVESMYNSGLVTFINMGTVTIPEGGSFAPGQSDILNHGTFAVEAGGELLLERGTQFSNYAAMENSGYIRVDDGGAITDMEGSIANQGVMDIHSYFNGDISLITGEGTLNDKRE